jgi:hypothetical protein
MEEDVIGVADKQLQQLKLQWPADVNWRCDWEIEPCQCWYCFNTKYKVQSKDLFYGYHGTTYSSLCGLLGCGFKMEVPLPVHLGTKGKHKSFRVADKPRTDQAYVSTDFGCASQYAAGKYKKDEVQYITVMKVVSEQRKKTKKKEPRTDWLLTNAMATTIYIKKVPETAHVKAQQSLGGQWIAGMKRFSNNNARIGAALLAPRTPAAVMDPYLVIEPSHLWTEGNC